MKSTSPFLSNTRAVADTANKSFTNSPPADTLPNAQKPQLPRSEQIPVTIFTGYLGSGKTTVIANLMKQVGPQYTIAWLKNEIGSTGVDTELAASTQTTLVKEMLQGCICHVMLGALGDALDDLIASSPDRIIIETSGSVTPAPVVWEIRDHPALFVDGVVTVIDSKNFQGYKDKSFTLKMQAKYTDLILINKHEGLDESTLETNLDDLYEINLETPKIMTDRGVVSPELIFGLDSILFLHDDKPLTTATHEHQLMEVDLIEAVPKHVFIEDDLSKSLEALPGKYFYRIKAVLHGVNGPFVLNCAFGDHTITPLTKDTISPRIVFMGEDLLDYQEKILEIFHLSSDDLRITPRKHKN